MRKYGAFEVEKRSYAKHMTELDAAALEGASVDAKTREIRRGGKTIGVMAKGKPRAGFHSPSHKQEFFSQTMIDWGWPEYAVPTYIKSHVHRDQLDESKGEYPSTSWPGRVSSSRPPSPPCPRPCPLTSPC